MDTQFLVSFVRGRLVGPGQLRPGAGAVGLCDGPDGLRAGAGEGGALSILRALWRGDLLQSDDRPGGYERLAGAEPNAVRLLVLHHELLPLPDGDIPRDVGHAVAAVVHLLHPGVGGGERARPVSRPAGRAQSLEDWLCPASRCWPTAASLMASRWVFQRAIGSYRSARVEGGVGDRD